MKVEFPSPSFTVVEYESHLLGYTLKGEWPLSEGVLQSVEWEAAAWGRVVVPDSVKAKVLFKAESPSGCDCGVTEECMPRPVPYTAFTWLAFVDVPEQHQREVRSLGKTLRVVRIPVVKPISLADFTVPEE